MHITTFYSLPISSSTLAIIILAPTSYHNADHTTYTARFSNTPSTRMAAVTYNHVIGNVGRTCVSSEGKKATSLGDKVYYTLELGKRYLALNYPPSAL